MREEDAPDPILSYRLVPTCFLWDVFLNQEAKDSCVGATPRDVSAELV